MFISAMVASVVLPNSGMRSLRSHVFAGEHHGTFAVGDRSGRVRVGGDVHRAVREVSL